jgi:hypothetical protein
MILLDHWFCVCKINHSVFVTQMGLIQVQAAVSYGYTIHIPIIMYTYPMYVDFSKADYKLH